MNNSNSDIVEESLFLDPIFDVTAFEPYIIYSGQGNIDGKSCDVIIKSFPNSDIIVEASGNSAMNFIGYESYQKEKTVQCSGFEAFDAVQSSLNFSANEKGINTRVTFRPLKIQTPNRKIHALYFTASNAPFWRGKWVKYLSGEGAIRLKFTYEGWEIILDSLASEKDKKRIKGGEYGRNLRGKIYRSDGFNFDSNNSEVENILDAVGWSLSFAVGRWISPDVYTGVDSNNKVAYKRFTEVRVSQYQSNSTWFSEMYPNSLEDVFLGFVNLLKNPIWTEPLTHVLTWYLDSQDKLSGTREGHLIWAQTALELLGWVWLTQDEKICTENKYNKNTMPKNIENTLDYAGIDKSIPSELKDLIAFQTALKSYPSVNTKIDPLNAPSIITHIRNSFVHPKQKGKQQFLPPLGSYEALKLALYYIELLVLRIAGVKGRILSRISSKTQGDFFDLPWNISTPEKN